MIDSRKILNMWRRMHLLFYSKLYSFICMEGGLTKIFDSHLWIPLCITSESFWFPWILLQFTRYSFPTTDTCSAILASITFEFALQARVGALRVRKTGATGLLCYQSPFSVMVFAPSVRQGETEVPVACNWCMNRLHASPSEISDRAQIVSP